MLKKSPVLKDPRLRGDDPGISNLFSLNVPNHFWRLWCSECKADLRRAAQANGASSTKRTQAGFRSRRIRHVRSAGRSIPAPKRLARKSNAAIAAPEAPQIKKAGAKPRLSISTALLLV
jgi:hypothetical protein